MAGEAGFEADGTERAGGAAGGSHDGGNSRGYERIGRSLARAPRRVNQKQPGRPEEANAPNTRRYGTMGHDREAFIDRGAGFRRQGDTDH